MSAENGRSMSLMVGFDNDRHPPIVVTFYVDGQYSGNDVGAAEDRVIMQVAGQLPRGWKIENIDYKSVHAVAERLMARAKELSKVAESSKQKRE